MPRPSATWFGQTPENLGFGQNLQESSYNRNWVFPATTNLPNVSISKSANVDGMGTVSFALHGPTGLNSSQRCSVTFRTESYTITTLRSNRVRYEEATIKGTGRCEVPELQGIGLVDVTITGRGARDSNNNITGWDFSVEYYDQKLYIDHQFQAFPPN